MSIYTKTGDKGETSLFGGKRVSKTHPQVDAYGNVDELTSFLGLVITKLTDSKDKELLIQIQKDLYQIMGILAGATNVDIKNPASTILRFENKIDELDTRLPKLTTFILPGGTEIAALLHVSRTICRRAERSVVYLLTLKSKVQSLESTIRYLNRLSDLLFTFARYYAQGKEIATK